MSEIKIQCYESAKLTEHWVSCQDPNRLISTLSKRFLDDENQNRFRDEARAWTLDLLGADLVSLLGSLPAASYISIESDQQGQRIPWEALVVGNEFLGTRFAIRRILNQRQTDDSVGTANCELPMQPTVVLAKAPELIHYGHELPAVRGLMRQIATQNPNTFTPPQTDLMETDSSRFAKQLNSCDWLHFVGHTRKKSGVRSLQLSPDEFFSPNEIKRLDRTPSIVFLSACAALEIPRKAVNDPNTETILLALVQRGSKWIAGATLPFGDHECRQIVTTFYESILDGCTPAESMRLARLKAIQSNRCRVQVALSFVVYEQDGFSLSLSAPGSRTIKEFPIDCAGCGKKIETRHGIGDAGWQDSIVCRECCRTGRKASYFSEQQKTTDNDEPEFHHRHPAKRLPEVSSSPEHSSDRENQTEISDFQQLVVDSLESFDQWEDFESGTVTRCKVIRPDQLGESPRKLRHVTPTRRPSSSNWTESFVIVSDQDAKAQKARSNEIGEPSPFFARLSVSQLRCHWRTS